MMNLWPLVRAELTRLLPELAGWAQRLSVSEDGAAAAQWQRRLESFQGALVVLENAVLSRFVMQLAAVWRAGGRERAARLTEAGLAWLSSLAELDATAASRRLDELPEFLKHFEHDAPAPAARTAGDADSRLVRLFAQEVEDKTAQLDRLLLQLEAAPDRLELIAPMMRAAHSLKGAARAVRNEAFVNLAHGLEDRLAAAQKAGGTVTDATIDDALRTIDTLRSLSRAMLEQQSSPEPPPALAAPVQEASEIKLPAAAQPPPGYIASEDSDPVLRIRASLIGELIALAGSGMVESRRLKLFAERQQRLRRQLGDAARALDALHHRLGAPAAKTALGAELADLRERVGSSRRHVNDWMEDFGEYMRESFDLTERIYHRAAQTRLRPFGEIASGYPRMLRDLARRLGKRVRVLIDGEALAVDRDVLERIDAPLTHLLRNALDHGIESPERRRAAGKADEGQIRVRASYRAGMLAVDVGDDGAGIDSARIRAKLVADGVLDAATAATLDDERLFDHLFGAGFSTRDEVSETSGRGVGLDVVRQMVKQLDGQVRISSRAGHGTCFHLLVPISRVVTRALAVTVAGEAYAFPLLRVERVVRATPDQTHTVEGLQFVALENRHIGLLPLAEQLELGTSRPGKELIDLVVISVEGRSLAFVVDSILGEFDLATRPLDSRLGRIADLAALALLPDGAPVVLLDVDDLMRGALESRRARLAGGGESREESRQRQRVLVVDDSISVRELERQLLAAHGYEVAVAVDGMDAWSRLREWPCDLVVTDVDMPRLDGIELTRSIKQDPHLRALPVVIVSYRDRPEDRARGLEVRADAYLTKSDFHEDRFVEAVRSLIGGAEDGG